MADLEVELFARVDGGPIVSMGKMRIPAPTDDDEKDVGFGWQDGAADPPGPPDRR